MKKYTAICLAIAALLTGGLVQSQTNTAAPPMGQGRQAMTPEERFNRLSEALNLNEDQKAKVQETFEETRQKIQVAIEEARSNAEVRLQQVLTPEQFQKLQAFWAHPEHHGNISGSNTNQESAH